MYIHKYIYYILQKFIFQDSTDPITYESIMGDTEDESFFKIYYNMWFETKQPATHKVEKRTRYLSIYQTFNENMKFQFYSKFFFVE